MARLNQLSDILFAVEEQPVCARIATEDGQHLTPIPEKKAIVNVESGRVLGVVGRGYRLVTNQQALDWGKQCCRTVFPETNAREWQVSAVEAPGTGGHCHIDLVHNTASLDFTHLPAQSRPDAYGPFIRVSNSYNGIRALAFNIGFQRKVCTNGLMASDTVIRFKFAHQKAALKEEISFTVARDKLHRMKTTFCKQLTTLSQYHLEPSQIRLLVYAALRLQPPPDNRFPQDWENLEAHIEKLCSSYEKELGTNAYAALNTMTDFASHPLSNRNVRRDRHSYQRLAGQWLDDFFSECRRPDFDLSYHIEHLAQPKGKVDAKPFLP